MLMWLLVEVRFFLMVKAKGVQVMYGQELGDASRVRNG
jgi:hypothetical protein